MAHTRRGGAAGRAALAGVLGGLSLAMLYLSVLAPAGRLGFIAAAGLFPAGAVISSGLGTGIFCYGTAGLLVLLLLPDKGHALLYLFFFGLWPMVKSLIERLEQLALELLCKLAFFNLTLSLLLAVLRETVLSFLPPALSRLWMIYLGGNIAFLIYDLGFSKLIAFYSARIDRVLRRGV